MAKAASAHGKAFEYAVIIALQDAVSDFSHVDLQENRILAVARDKYSLLSDEERVQYSAAADVGVKMLIGREPKIETGQLANSKLQLYLQTDQMGQGGDVRDIVIRREDEDWEVGISAKHNHKAVKSSRLGRQLDFGKSWLQEPCSAAYLSKVAEVFDGVSSRVGRETWKSLGDEKYGIYEAILKEFKEELWSIFKRLGKVVPERLIRYLVGNCDFHKIMKIRDKTQLQPFNLNGSLGQRSKVRRATPESEILPLPTKIYDIHFKDDSRTTLHLACDAGWQISFRIHNASTLVEPSLKFDITLIGHPPQLVTQELPWRSKKPNGWD